MAKQPTNQEIIDRMLAVLRGSSPKLAATPQTPPCSSDFTVSDFAVTYPNRELMINVSVTGIPSGATLVGATAAVGPSSSAGTIYCMAVVGESAGLSLPVSVLAASTSQVFSTATTVTGTVILSYMTGGTFSQCVITQQFKVGG